MAQITLKGVQVLERAGDSDGRVLTPEALAFVGALHREFEAVRARLLQRRAERQAELDGGVLPGFLPATEAVRRNEWTVAPPPADLEDRRVEITGPVERKMMINALNSGANVFMADFEDALSPTWSNIVEGQANLLDAVRRTLEYAAPDGRRYRMGERPAVLVVRPRGWHLVERHVLVDDEPVSAALFDSGLYLFQNARALLEHGTGPYFYLPKLENHLEARLWNDVFCYAQDALGLPRGTIRATVLIENLLAAFEMEEILYELREHVAGLNAGRWDYIFSVIKKLRGHPGFLLPDRASITMETPFMRAYTELLVRSCHRRGAHAIGGMAAFIPSRRDARVNAVALAEVRRDKLREARDGFDGTWVAHPDLVPVARGVFDEALVGQPNQKSRLREDVRVSAADLLDVRVSDGRVTAQGLATNVGVALEYLGAWLGGLGAVAISNLMEDAATAEICRAQLWQWLHHGVPLADAGHVTAERYRAIRERELERLVAAGESPGRFREAAELLDGLVFGSEFTEFLTTGAYRHLP